MATIPVKRQKHPIGVISDTHGLVRPQALEALKGSELVIHAGDIGKSEVITALRSIAPVVAIRGNNDRDGWARSFPETTVVEVGKASIYILHNVKDLDLDPVAADFSVVISGHSHRPSIVKRDGILFVNPGSAGPRRFNLPVALARLQVKGASVNAEIIDLGIR